MADLNELAALCAARLNPTADTSDAALQACQDDFLELLHAIRDSHPRYAFDRSGRPGAIRAIREALPIVEAELLDAVLEDVACELAAVQEAWCRLAVVRHDTRR